MIDMPDIFSVFAYSFSDYANANEQKIISETRSTFCPFVNVFSLSFSFWEPNLSHRQKISSSVCVSKFKMATAETFDASLFKYGAGYYQFLPGYWLPGKLVPGGLFTFSQKGVDSAVSVEVEDTDFLVATFPKTGTVNCA